MRRKVKVRCCACGKSIDLMDSFSKGYCKAYNAGFLCGTCSVAYNIGLKEGVAQSTEVVDAKVVEDKCNRILEKLELIRLQNRCKGRYL